MIQMLFLLGVGFNCFAMAYECDKDPRMQPKWFMWLVVLIPYLVFIPYVFFKLLDWFEERHK